MLMYSYLYRHVFLRAGVYGVLIYSLFFVSCNDKPIQDSEILSLITCTDGIRNGDEIDIDCGGLCPPCAGLVELKGTFVARMQLDIRLKYILTGPFLIRDGATLEIPAGTTIKVLPNIGAHIAVAQGGKLYAWGNKDEPILFTSNALKPQQGDWGGILFCGKAPTNTGSNSRSEIGDYFYGGTEEDDTSGFLRYVKIEYAGALYNENVRFNALSFFGVGHKTTLNYVSVTNSAGTAFKWYGGSVSGMYLSSNKTAGHGMEIVDGWQGKGSFWHTVENKNAGIYVKNINNKTSSNKIDLSNISIIGNKQSNGIEIRNEGALGAFKNIYIKDTNVGIWIDSGSSFEQLSSGRLNFEDVFLNGFNQFSNLPTVYPTYINQGNASGSGNQSELPDWASF